MNFILIHKLDDETVTIQVSDRDSWLTARELREKFNLNGGLIELRRCVEPNVYESVCAPGLARRIVL